MLFELGLRVIVWPAVPCGETEARVGQRDEETDAVQEDEEDVVSEHHPLEVIGLSILHHGRAPVLHEHVVHKEDGKELPGTAVHERQPARERVRRFLPEVMIVVVDAIGRGQVR